MHSDHRRHDRLLIVRFAANDSHPAQVDEAKSLVASCPECAALAQDIRLLSRAVTGVPAPRRPRSFQLTPDQAERLRGSRLDRLLRALGDTGWGTLRPVAGVALSIGLVMATIGAWPLGGLTAGQPAAEPFSAQRPDTVSITKAPATDAPAFVPDAAGGEAGPIDEQPGAEAEPPAADPLSDAYIDRLGAGDAETDGQPRATSEAQQAVSSGGSLLLYVGLAIAILATGTLTLAWLARSRYSDPLLR